MAAEGSVGFEQVAGCESFFVITADPAAASPIEGAETFASALAGKAPTFETVAADPPNPAGIPNTPATPAQPKAPNRPTPNITSNRLSGNRLLVAASPTPNPYLCFPRPFHPSVQTVTQTGRSP